MARLNSPVMILLATLLVIGCGQLSCRSDDGVDPSSTPQASPFHGISSPAEYFDIVPFNISEYLNGFRSDYNVLPITKESYTEALGKLTERGPEDLTATELQSILAVSWFAFMTQLQSVEYSITESDSQGRESAATVEASYKPESAPDVTGLSMPMLVGSHVVRQTSGPGPGKLTASEIIDVFQEDETGSGPAVLTRWQREDSAWQCQRGDAGMERAFAWPFFAPDVAFIQATPAGTELVNGRPAYKLRPPENAESGWGTPTGYWLDEETLLPVQYEYLKSGPGWADEEQGNTVTFTLLGVNSEVEIQPPDVNVACEEKDFTP